MKKLFTLLGVVLMATTAFGQQRWKDIVVNGDCEGAAPAYTDYNSMPADAWNSFWVHEFPVAGEAQYQGTATIVDGLGVDGSKCVKVVARSDEEAVAAGNRTEANGALASWDCQFFIYGTEPMPQGKEVRLTMWVKADKAGSIETQAHYGPGNYNHYQLFGNIAVTTEWKQVVTDVIVVSADQGKEADGKFFQSVAFNLSTDKAGNVFYFDNIKLQMKDPKEQNENADWINFMRRGIYSMDHITGVNSEGKPWSCTNFTVQDLNKPAGEQQQPAPVVEVPGEPGVMAVKVPVRGYYIKEEEDLDEAGEPKYDEDGNPMTKSVYYWNDGTKIGDSAPARWTCQFFVSTLHKMKSGERYRFNFKVKADKPSALGTQAHTGPGQYVSYNTFGGENDYPITTDWTEYLLGDGQGNWPTIPSGANGCQTITFDCCPLEGDDNTFYFIFVECSFTEDNVTDDDRTLGTPEYLVLVGPDADEDKVYPINAEPMLTTYDAEDFSFLTAPKSGDGIKLLSQKEDPDEEGALIDTYSSMLTLKDGGFIDDKGYFLGDDDKGIQLYFDPKSIDGKNINLMAWNNPDAKIAFGDGKVICTKLAISQSGWYYLYNIAMMSQADYDAYLVALKNVIDLIDAIGTVELSDECKARIDAARAAFDALPVYGQKNVSNYNVLTAAEEEYANLLETGISTVTVAPVFNNVIYDLMGRKVSKPTKGLYIVNGKKYFLK